MQRRKDIEVIGKKFGRMTIISTFYQQKEGQCSMMMCNCKCDCGNEKTVYWKNLRDGMTTSCGCVQKERLRNYVKKTKSEFYNNVISDSKNGMTVKELQAKYGYSRNGILNIIKRG